MDALSWCCFTDTHSRLVSHICWKGRLPWLCRHIPDLTISGNQSERSHKPYHSSLSPLTLPTPKRFMWHTYYADADQARVVFLIFTQNHPSLPRQFAVQSVKWHMEGEGWKERTPAVALAFRRGRSTDCKLWSAFLCIRCARYRAYSINMHSSWVINRRGLKRDGAVSGSGQLSVPLSVTGRERQTDTTHPLCGTALLGFAAFKMF